MRWNLTLVSLVLEQSPGARQIEPGSLHVLVFEWCAADQIEVGFEYDLVPEHSAVAASQM